MHISSSLYSSEYLNLSIMSKSTTSSSSSLDSEIRSILPTPSLLRKNKPKTIDPRVKTTIPACFRRPHRPPQVDSPQKTGGIIPSHRLQKKKPWIRKRPTTDVVDDILVELYISPIEDFVAVLASSSGNKMFLRARSPYYERHDRQWIWGHCHVLQYHPSLDQFRIQFQFQHKPVTTSTLVDRRHLFLRQADVHRHVVPVSQKRPPPDATKEQELYYLFRPLEISPLDLPRHWKERIVQRVVGNHGPECAQVKLAKHQSLLVQSLAQVEREFQQTLDRTSVIKYGLIQQQHHLVVGSPNEILTTARYRKERLVPVHNTHHSWTMPRTVMTIVAECTIQRRYPVEFRQLLCHESVSFFQYVIEISDQQLKSLWNKGSAKFLAKVGMPSPSLSSHVYSCVSHLARTVLYSYVSPRSGAKISKTTSAIIRRMERHGKNL